MNITDILEFTVFIAGLIVTLCLSFLLIASLYALTLGPKYCDGYGRATGLTTEFDFWSTCYVTMNDGRVLDIDSAKTVLTNEYNVNIKN